MKVNLHAEQTKLLDEAEKIVRQFFSERGGFTTYALVLDKEGKIIPVQPSNEFTDAKAAFTALLTHLLTLATKEQITASAICAPINVGVEKAIIYDLEQKTSPRFFVIQPYMKNASGSWTFGPKEFKSERPKVFVTASEFRS